MSLKDVQPHADPELLRKQFHALKVVALGLERQLRELHQLHEDQNKWIARMDDAEINSQRDANAMLTDECERMRRALESIKPIAVKHRRFVIASIADMALRGVDPSPLRSETQ